MAQRLSSYAGSGHVPLNRAYPYNTMNELVYPVHGGMEDWGYGVRANCREDRTSSLAHLLTNALTYSLTVCALLTHSLASLVNLLTHALCSLTLTDVLTYSLMYLLTDVLTYSLTFEGLVGHRLGQRLRADQLWRLPEGALARPPHVHFLVRGRVRA